VTAVAVVVVLIVAAIVLGKRLSASHENSAARDTIRSFVGALRRHDFAGACGFLASTAPPRATNATRCSEQLRSKNLGVGWDYMLRTIETRVEAHHGNRIDVVAWEPEGLIGGGPRYRFTLYWQDGALRIEHFFGFF
jgi:hypothetical protein